jgi:predicted DNA-binding transcriptional regulator AlpA
MADEFLTIDDLAGRIGRRVQTIYKYRLDSKPGGKFAARPFPKPDRMVGISPVWRESRLPEIKAWVAERRITGRPRTQPLVTRKTPRADDIARHSYTTDQLAQILGVLPATVRNWMKDSRKGRYRDRPFPVPDGPVRNLSLWRRDRLPEITAWVESREGRGRKGKPRGPRLKDGYLSVPDLATHFGKTSQSIHKYLSESCAGGRYADRPFPGPDQRAGGMAAWKLSRLPEIEAWVALRRPYKPRSQAVG